MADHRGVPHSNLLEDRPDSDDSVNALDDSADASDDSADALDDSVDGPDDSLADAPPSNELEDWPDSDDTSDNSWKDLYDPWDNLVDPFEDLYGTTKVIRSLKKSMGNNTSDGIKRLQSVLDDFEDKLLSTTSLSLVPGIRDKVKSSVNEGLKVCVELEVIFSQLDNLTSSTRITTREVHSTWGDVLENALRQLNDAVEEVSAMYVEVSGVEEFYGLIAREGPLRLLGQGIDGKVEEIGAPKHFYENTTALKEYQGEKAEANMRREYKVLQALQERIPPEDRGHIIKAEGYRTWSDEEGNHWANQMTPIATDSFKEFFKREIASNDLPKIMSCMIVGLAIIHAAGIWHHDIHSGNILLWHEGIRWGDILEWRSGTHKPNIFEDKGLQGSPIYTDFCAAHVFEETGNCEVNEDRNGSPTHQAQFSFPDICDEHEKEGKADVFSLGGVLVQALAILLDNREVTASLPTTGFSLSAILLQKESNDKVRTALGKFIPKGELSSLDPGAIEVLRYITIIQSMLDPNPQSRPTAKEAAISLLPEVPDSIVDMLPLDMMNMCLGCWRWCHRFKTTVATEKLILPGRTRS